MIASRPSHGAGAGSAPSPQKPLVVRLRNWVGDVVLSTPLLLRLEAAGYALTLVGKPWATDLLAGFGWPVLRLGSSSGDRVHQLSQWRTEVAQERWGSPKGINALSLPYSFSSAWEMRRAGLKAIGYDGEARRLLLHRSWPRPRFGQAGHELEVYWRLGQYLLETDPVESPPRALLWKRAPQHQAQADALMAAHGLRPGFILLCPFAGGTFEGHDKRWPEFARCVREALPSLGRTLVVCPGPGEEAEAQAYAEAGLVLPGVGLGTLAALMGRASLMISNDTGPGHLAAAVGIPLLSVLGPTEPGHWGAWGPQVAVERHWPRWPTTAEVVRRAHRMLGS